MTVFSPQQSSSYSVVERSTFQFSCPYTSQNSSLWIRRVNACTGFKIAYPASP